MNTIGTSYENEYVELPPPELLLFSFESGSALFCINVTLRKQSWSPAYISHGVDHSEVGSVLTCSLLVKLEVKGPVGQQWDSVEKAKGKIYFFNTV